MGVADTAPSILTAPAMRDLPQQCLWTGSQAGDEIVASGPALAVALDRRGGQLHDPGTAGPGDLDLMRGFLGPDLPAGDTPVAFLLIRCSEGDPALSVELTADLPVQVRLETIEGQGVGLNQLSVQLLCVEKLLEGGALAGFMGVVARLIHKRPSVSPERVFLIAELVSACCSLSATV